MANRPKKKNVTIQQLLAALLDDKAVFPPAYLHHFSDLDGDDLNALQSIWPQVSPNRRFTLLEDLEEMADVDMLVSFEAIAMVALKDEDPRVRTVAVRLLYESDNLKLAETFMSMLAEDPDIEVRAAAATGLGMYVYEGELEEIPEELFRKIENYLLKVVSGEDNILVRRRALEAMGVSGRDEVPPLIRKAYESGDQDWLISALFAMGRSADESWGPDVVRMLRHPQTKVQIEAAQAAGELALDAARRPLLKLLDDELQDSELRVAIYWALSKIGGEDVRETFETRLEETEDDEEAETIESALENLDFTEEMDAISLLEFDDLPDVDQDLQEYLSDRNARIINLDDEDTPDDIDLNPPDNTRKPGRKRHKPH